jgi:hypothetical protein
MVCSVIPARSWAGSKVAFQQSRQLGIKPFLRFRQITGDAGEMIVRDRLDRF